MNESFITEVITIGRNSKKEHKVLLRLVYYNGRYYASRRDANSDWLKNILANKEATIMINDKSIRCLANIVNDDILAKQISKLKYNDERAMINRIIVELTPIA